MGSGLRAVGLGGKGCYNAGRSQKHEDGMGVLILQT